MLRPATIAPAEIASTHHQAEPAAVLRQEPITVTVSDSGEVQVGAPIVRVSEDWKGRLRSADEGIRARTEAGSLWVAPVAGGRTAVRISLPTATLVVEPGGCALSLVEHDGSVFVVVAAGPVELSRGQQRVALKPGTMVLLPAAGDPQIDHATPEEIGADPLVARNRQLDSCRR